MVSETTDEQEGRRCDGALVKDIDFEQMRQNILERLIPYEEAVKSNFLYPEKYMRMRYPSESEYKKLQSCFSTYAVITPDGKWHAPGEMGWFGMSTEQYDEKNRWDLNYYDRFIVPAIENNWYIIILDCHI